MGLTTQRLVFSDIGRTITFKTRNGNEVTGVIKAIRYRSTGVYLELEEDPNGVYQTDHTTPITLGD